LLLVSGAPSFLAQEWSKSVRKRAARAGKDVDFMRRVLRQPN
jgi:hypothetical protein